MLIYQRVCSQHCELNITQHFFDVGKTIINTHLGMVYTSYKNGDDWVGDGKHGIVLPTRNSQTAEMGFRSVLEGLV